MWHLLRKENTLEDAWSQIKLSYEFRKQKNVKMVKWYWKELKLMHNVIMTNNVKSCKTNQCKKLIYEDLDWCPVLTLSCNNNVLDHLYLPVSVSYIFGRLSLSSFTWNYPVQFIPHNNFEENGIQQKNPLFCKFQLWPNFAYLLVCQFRILLCE